MYLILTCIIWVLSSTDDESSGLYGFLNVIVHSASGLKQSLSKWLILLFLTRNHLTDYSKGCTWCHIIPCVCPDSSAALPPSTLSLLWLSAGRAAAGEQVGLARNTVYKRLQICLCLKSLPAQTLTKGRQAIVHFSCCYFLICLVTLELWWHQRKSSGIESMQSQLKRLRRVHHADMSQPADWC